LPKAQTSRPPGAPKLRHGQFATLPPGTQPKITSVPKTLLRPEGSFFATSRFLPNPLWRCCCKLQTLTNCKASHEQQVPDYSQKRVSHSSRADTTCPICRGRFDVPAPCRGFRIPSGGQNLLTRRIAKQEGLLLDPGLVQRISCGVKRPKDQKENAEE
jgi:hypothetical protein